MSDKPKLLETPKSPLTKTTKNYLLTLNDETFKLSLEYDEDNLEFRLEKPKMSPENYMRNYSLNELPESLKGIFYSLENFSTFIQNALEQKKVELIYGKNKEKMILHIKTNYNSKVIDFDLELNENLIPEDQVLRRISEEIKRFDFGEEEKEKSDEDPLDFVESKIKNCFTKITEEMSYTSNQNFENFKNDYEKIIDSLKEEFQNEVLELKASYENEINIYNQQLKNLKEQLSNNRKKINDIIKKKYKNNEESLNSINKLSLENIKYEKILIQNQNNYLTPFCIFIPLNNKIELIAIYDGDNENHFIEIRLIKSDILYESLKGHSSDVTSIQYFKNDKTIKDYLISGGKDKKVIVWDISNNFKKLYKIDCQYDGTILSNLLIFNIIDKDNKYKYNNYIVTSSNEKNSKDYSKIYSFENGKFLRNITTTKRNCTYHMLHWSYLNDHYIIELGDSKIVINNLFTDERYAKLKNGKSESKHIRGFIYLDKYLYCTCSNGFINIWDLVSKNIIDIISVFSGAFLKDVLLWNEDFLIVADYTNNSLDIVSLSKKKVVKQLKSPHKEGIESIGKLNDDKNEAFLLSSAKDKTIRMWRI